MKKIPTLFKRDPENMARVLSEVNPGCEWVLAGEGVATIKYDGVCVMFDGNAWWSRREVKPDKPEPPNWVEVDADPVTGKRMGWEPIEQSSFRKIFESAIKPSELEAGQTFELIGPKINGNFHNFTNHCLMRHGAAVDTSAPRDFEGLRDWMAIMCDGNLEGIVWHHPDGRRAKLKIKDVA
ncbi:MULTISPECIES: DUF5565 family protein [Nocardia]|uniref:RNA ligase 1 family protein n=1 Tax=Nocardia TaxID=1817 RepID=UPI002458A1E4|nr:MULTISPECIES: DUF5565 family protein [Nocardia]